LPPTARHILDEEMMLAYGADNKLPLPKVVSFDRLMALTTWSSPRGEGCGEFWKMQQQMRASA
jgi:hypothetical protein